MMEAVAPPPTFRLVPRPYQYEAVAALLAARARGVHRPLLVLPTGTGKTIVFALLVQRRRGRSLILAHRDELIQQAVDKLHLVDPTLPLGIVQAARDEHTAPTVVASVQTLSRRTRLTRLMPDFQTIVIDEVHHAPAPTYRRILDYCRARHPDGPLVVGVTATPERGDHHSLRQVFDRIVYELVASFHACPHGSPWPSWRSRAGAACGALEKYAACRASVEDGRRMITACFAHALQSCTSRISMHFFPCVSTG